MTQLKKFFNMISNNKIKVNDFVDSTKSRNLFVIDNDLWKKTYCVPTLEVKDDVIQLILSIEQANFYLNDKVVSVLEEFNTIMYKYINIYNAIESDLKIEKIDQFVKIVHNKILNNYEIYITHHNFLFFPKGKSFIKAIKKSMREDPDIILIEDLNAVDNIFLINNSTTNNLYALKYPESNENFIYSNTNKEIKCRFSMENKLYKQNELFEAIQSYLDITENDNCNILDPNLINNQEHLHNLIHIQKMSDI